MSKPRVLLISSRHLFGEGMETILRAVSDVELIGPCNLNDQNVRQQLLEARPSVVVIADEDLQSEAAAGLSQFIIEQYPELPVIRTRLNENIFRVVSTRTLPAHGDNLLDAIRGCIIRDQGLNEHVDPAMEMEEPTHPLPSEPGVYEVHDEPH